MLVQKKEKKAELKQMKTTVKLIYTNITTENQVSFKVQNAELKANFFFFSIHDSNNHKTKQADFDLFAFILTFGRCQAPTVRYRKQKRTEKIKKQTKNVNVHMNRLRFQRLYFFVTDCYWLWTLKVMPSSIRFHFHGFVFNLRVSFYLCFFLRGKCCHRKIV